MYIHEKENWESFRWDNERLSQLIEEVSRAQGRLFGRLSGLGFDSQLQTVAENLTHDVVYSSEIEGIRLNTEEVRSSIARRLGIENVKKIAPSHYVDSVVAVMLEAMEHYDLLLDEKKLCAWQAAFFPSGFSEGSQVEVGKYRSHEEHIVSGFLGRERIYYIAPSPERVANEMEKFLKWFNSEQPTSSIIRSGIAHFWFVSIHPFEDGNGRLARIISDMMLARGDKSRMRFYNISSQINHDKNHYYKILEKTQRGNGDITEWLEWYLKTLLSAIREADVAISTVLNKNAFWQRIAGISLSKRQIEMLNLFLDGYEAKITSKNWASLSKCSKDTAIRDIQDMVQKGILREEVPGAKRPSYVICFKEDTLFTNTLFTNVKVEEESHGFYLSATFKGAETIREKLLSLDSERLARGEILPHQLLEKYFCYLL